MKLKLAYNKTKPAKVGDTVVCPSCGTKFIKKHYQQKFCRTKGGTVCKDKYWNTVTENKRNNVTRISPASKAFLTKQEQERQEVLHPFEGLNDEDYKNH